MKTTIYDCVVLELPKVENIAGSITPINSNINIPFDIERTFYLYDIPGGQVRGGHAHKGNNQIIVAASGSFDVSLDDGINRKVIRLNRPYHGLYIPYMIWNELSNFSAGAICLVLASHHFEEAEYIRDYDNFVELRKQKYNE